MTIGTVATAGLNLRAAPNDHAKVLDQLTKGDAFTVLPNEGMQHWLKIRVTKAKGGYADGKEGWVYRKDVTLEAPKPQPAPRPVPPAPRSKLRLFDVVVSLGVAVLVVGLVYLVFS